MLFLWKFENFRSCRWAWYVHFWRRATTPWIKKNCPYTPCFHTIFCRPAHANNYRTQRSLCTRQWWRQSSDACDQPGLTTSLWCDTSSPQATCLHVAPLDMLCKRMNHQATSRWLRRNLKSAPETFSNPHHLMTQWSHDADAAALSQKHHLFIHVGAGPIQLVYSSPLQLATDGTVTPSPKQFYFRPSILCVDSRHTTRPPVTSGAHTIGVQ